MLVTVEFIVKRLPLELLRDSRRTHRQQSASTRTATASELFLFYTCVRVLEEIDIRVTTDDLNEPDSGKRN